MSAPALWSPLVESFRSFPISFDASIVRMADTDVSLDEALRCHRAGDLDGAERLYRQILAAHPTHAPTLYFSGLSALQRGDLQGGIESISAAISHDSRQPAYHNRLGEAYRAAGNLAAAKACFQRALALWPQSAELHNNLGSTLHALDDHKAERREFEEAIRLRPDFAQAHHNLGIALQVEGRFDEAAQCHRRALELEPNLAAAMGALGYALQETGQPEEAAAEYRRYLQLVPQDAKVRENLATVLRMLRRFDEAATEYDLVIQSAGPSLDRLIFLGECAQRLRKLDKAIDCYRQAVALDPTRPEPHFCLGTALLAVGDFVQGWPEYEWQLKRFSRYRSLPAWDGRPLHGESIVLFSQAGLGYGDVLQFVRYANLVCQRGGDVVLDVDKSLVRLLLLSGFREVVATGTTIHPPCAYQAAIMSLPRIFGIDADSFPGGVPYLHAEPDSVADWGQRLRPFEGFKIGIHWHGSRAAVRDGRVIPLEQFEAVAHVPGVQLFSLQSGPGGKDLSRVASDWPITDLSTAISDFHDSAAIMSNLDLVITLDSAPAHLAGALGVPVWVALPYSAEWRWLAERDDSPWYPTMRLFRQSRVNEWGDVFERIAAELTQLLAKRASR